MGIINKIISKAFDKAESIIGIEITNLEISLVKWFLKDNKVVKTTLEGPIALELFWN